MREYYSIYQTMWQKKKWLRSGTVMIPNYSAVLPIPYHPITRQLLMKKLVKLAKQQQLCKRPKDTDSTVLSYLSVSFSLSALSSRPTSSFTSPGRSLRRPPPLTINRIQPEFETVKIGDTSRKKPVLWMFHDDNCERNIKPEPVPLGPKSLYTIPSLNFSLVFRRGAYSWSMIHLQPSFI